MRGDMSRSTMTDVCKPSPRKSAATIRLALVVAVSSPGSYLRLQGVMASFHQLAMPLCVRHRGTPILYPVPAREFHCNGKNQIAHRLRQKRGDDLDSAESFPEGAELARELYEQVRIREVRSKLIDAERKGDFFASNSDLAVEESREARLRNRDPFLGRPDIGFERNAINIGGRRGRTPSGYFSADTCDETLGLFGSSTSLSGATADQWLPIVELERASEGILLHAAFGVLVLTWFLAASVTGEITDAADQMGMGSFTDSVTPSAETMTWI